MPIIISKNPGDEQAIADMRTIGEAFGIDVDTLMADGPPGESLTEDEPDLTMRQARIQIAALIRFSLEQRERVTEIAGKNLLATAVLLGRLAPEAMVTLGEALPNPWPPKDWRTPP